MAVTNLLGSAAGFLTTLAFLPQVVKSFRTRSVRDLSWGMLLIFSAGVVLWIFYGLSVRSAPVVVANAVTLALNLSLVALKARSG